MMSLVQKPVTFGIWKSEKKISLFLLLSRVGQCMTINACYPERKIFQTEAKDTWIFGLYNTCQYESARGTQVFGVCCTKYTPQVPRIPNEVESDVPSDKDISSRKCSPMPTNHQCTYDGRRIVNGKETNKNAYPFMVILVFISKWNKSNRRFFYDFRRPWCESAAILTNLDNFAVVHWLTRVTF